MIRNDISLSNYHKISNFLKENPTKSYKLSFLRNKLNIDFYSVEYALNILLKENLIKKEKDFFQWNNKGG